VKERKEANLIQNDRARNISDSGEGEAFVFAPDLDEHREPVHRSQCSSSPTVNTNASPQSEQRSMPSGRAAG
jgi:hypothetical protein